MKDSMFSFRLSGELREKIEAMSGNPKYLDGKGSFVLSWAVIDMIKVGLATTAGDIPTVLVSGGAKTGIKIEVSISQHLPCG